MKHGFIKVAALTPTVVVADTEHNKQEIEKLLKEAKNENAKIVVFPELCVTGCSCGDLFFQELLLEKAKTALFEIAQATTGYKGLAFVGLPLEYQGKLYNVAAAICDGEILGFIPKTYLPNSHEANQERYFATGMTKPVMVELDIPQKGLINVPMGTDLIFRCPKLPKLTVAAEIGDDLWAPNPPSVYHALAGANLIVNLSASNETTGKDEYRRALIENQSARLICGYIEANAGEGESTQDLVYAGHNIIAENGNILNESKRFSNESIYSEIDVNRIADDRRAMDNFHICSEDYEFVDFDLDIEETTLTRFIDPAPFIPKDDADKEKRCEEIFTIQAMGLKKRLAHAHSKAAVVGISGGLDSTLALLVTAKAYDLLGQDHKGIIAVTMPGFGTTDRTYDNAVSLINSLGCTFKEISIAQSVTQHFKDIGHDISNHDVTYENSQARERTQILMDVSNMYGGLVVGTGDLSELALGWATYNGDHMAMYGVNASIPKTLVRHLVRYYADTCGDEQLAKVLYDVLDTPVSPELLPPEDGKIAQKTEDLVGPYELHDFFLYYVLRFGFMPKKIFRLAKKSFSGTYDDETIKKWLGTFFRRFFTQQFKRSCLPDGPKVGTCGVSPRGDLVMPSDASAAIWQKEIEEL